MTMLEHRRIHDAAEVHPFALSALDAAECRAGGMEPQAALALSVARSEAAYALVAGGDVLCVWGYRTRSVLGGGVDMWLLGGGGVRERGRAFARESRAVLAGVLADFTSIRVLVWVYHASAVRWLRWLGFRMLAAPAPQGFVVMQKDRG